MLIIALALTCLMFTVMITDITRFQIPNWAVIAITALYPVCLYLAPVMPDWKMALLIALGTFIVGFAIFAAGIMGGGDIKLLTALALFAGMDAFLPFIMGVGVLGGLLALLLVIIRPLTAYLFSKLEKPPTISRILTVGEPVPYGVAIAISFLILLWSAKIPGIVL